VSDPVPTRPDFGIEVPVQACHRDDECDEPQHRLKRVPLSIARHAFEEWYAPRYGRSQSFEELHRRGGFSWGELIASGAPHVKPHHKPEDRRG
jgi:hypothetical protein